jgi:hypothetical protein
MQENDLGNIGIITEERIKENKKLLKKKKKDNSKKGDMFLNCRSCKTIITNDYRSKFDTRYCADCL